jgi:hypothetical protein
MPSWPVEYRYDPCDRCGYALCELATFAVAYAGPLDLPVTNFSSGWSSYAADANRRTFCP